MNAEPVPIQSMSFPQEVFGYSYHALMVPPFAPRALLMLGYGMGTVHRLINLIWGDQINVTAVDIMRPDVDLSDVTFIHENAREFVDDFKGEPYDMTIIDLYSGSRIPQFVFSDQFADKVASMTGKILVVNCTFYEWKDFSNFGKYFLLDCVKSVNSNVDDEGDRRADKVLFFRTK